ncbi:hypothetical protein A9Q83_03975 [Alphaproteobacteria bacterium 46_93_T64]|nr:hypothetical protein A9Q83_03975 [Alphaproteobacteria bacterium 46_93_T64]
MKKLYWLIGIVAVLVGAAEYYRSTIVNELKLLDETARAEAPGNFANLENGKVHYQWHGPENGDVTVLVHGFSTPSFVWKGLLVNLTNAGLRVLTYDHFGRGWSDRPNTVYDAKFYDTQLLRLLEQMNIKRPVNMVGYSMGGAVSTFFAANHPDKVKNLALIAPAGFPVNEGTMAQIIKLPIMGDWLMDVVGRKSMLEEMQKPANQGKAIPDIVARYDAQMAYAGYLPALLSTLRHFPMSDMQTEYIDVGRTDLPVLAIWGTEDTVVPPSNAELLKTAIPSASLKFLKEGTHAITYSMPDEVSKELVSFFTQ